MIVAGRYTEFTIDSITRGNISFWTQNDRLAAKLDRCSINKDILAVDYTEDLEAQEIRIYF